MLYCDWIEKIFNQKYREDQATVGELDSYIFVYIDFTFYLAFHFEKTSELLYVNLFTPVLFLRYNETFLIANCTLLRR